MVSFHFYWRGMLLYMYNNLGLFTHLLYPTKILQCHIVFSSIFPILLMYCGVSSQSPARLPLLKGYIVT